MSVMVKNKTNKNYKRSQKGRSMVEMLGVLAIIGVLSVGGVYGYGVAMKKHKANELLHQASMLATTISAQAMTNDGKLPETITDFGNSGYDTELTDNGTKFILTMKDVDSAVCNQLKIGGMVQGVDCKEGTSEGKMNAEITYYKNLATNDEEGKNSPIGGSAGTADPLCQDVKCETGQQCIGGACAEVSACTGDCRNCFYEFGQTICEETIGCSQNSDCDEWCENNSYDKCYCAISSSPTWDDSNCYTSFTGTCAEVKTKPGISDGYVASNRRMTWWSAVNFCKAAKTGGKLVSLSDLGITGGYEDDASCLGSDCTGANWSDLQSKVGYDFYQVTDAVSCTDPEMGEGCTSGSNNNSCYTFDVNPDYSSVDLHLRSSSNVYALCE